MTSEFTIVYYGAAHWFSIQTGSYWEKWIGKSGGNFSAFENVAFSKFVT